MWARGWKRGFHRFVNSAEQPVRAQPTERSLQCLLRVTPSLWLSEVCSSPSGAVSRCHRPAPRPHRPSRRRFRRRRPYRLEHRITSRSKGRCRATTLTRTHADHDRGHDRRHGKRHASRTILVYPTSDFEFRHAHRNGRGSIRRGQWGQRPDGHCGLRSPDRDTRRIRHHGGSHDHRWHRSICRSPGDLHRAARGKRDHVPHLRLVPRNHHVAGRR